MPEQLPAINLLDHFRPPVANRIGWHSFHQTWAIYLSAFLNRALPEGYFAVPNIQYNVEIDVSVWEEPLSAPISIPETVRNGGGVWVLPEPMLTLPLPALTDVVEVQIFAEGETNSLVAALELVSPANKDRPAHREAFVSKCAALVQQGLGLVVVDVVTERWADLHTLLLARLIDQDECTMDSPLDASRTLFAASYAPILRNEEVHLNVWFEPMAVGAPLPTIPLCLKRGPSLPLPLAVTYATACQELRLPTALLSQAAV